MAEELPTGEYCMLEYKSNTHSEETQMITPQNNDEKNDVTIVGTDFFTDSESFLNELTDDELEQVRGGANNGNSNISLLICGPDNSTNTLVLCS